MRALTILVALAAAAPAQAGGPSAPYYGPAQGFLKGGYGYRETVEKDGSIRIEASARGPHALDIAMYRAAELARAGGYDYVDLLGGSGRQEGVNDGATLFARPSRSAAAPAACRSERRGCYTADAGELLRVLGGPDGATPGVPVVDHLDEHGREVRVSGFGLARAVAGPRAAVTPPAARFVRPAPVIRALSARAPSAGFDRLLIAQAGVRGGPVGRGWSIGD